MPTTINTGTGIRAGRGSLDYDQNGKLWVAVSDSSTGQARFYYSTDAGANWNLSSGSVSISGSFPIAFFIDKDNGAHLVLHSGSATEYRYGTLDAGGVTWTWSSPINLTPSGFTFSGRAPKVVAHREGGGWTAHAIHAEKDGSSIVKLYHAIIDITSTPSLRSNNEIYNHADIGDLAFDVDFRHEQSDPKAVQSATPSLYVVYHWTNGTTSTGLLYKKIAYSAGSWTPGTQRTLDALTALSSGFGMATLLYDGTRVVIAHIRDATNTVVRVDERDEADTTTTNRDPTALADGLVLDILCGYGPNQDIYLLSRANTSQDWKKIRFNRGGATWGSWSVVEADVGSTVEASGLMRGISPVSTIPLIGAAYILDNPTPDQLRFEKLVAAWEGAATLQGVATVSPDAALGIAAEASLQGVATISPTANMGLSPSALLQGVGTLDPKATHKPHLDFTVHDLYIDDGQNIFACIAHEDDQVKGATRANPARAQKQDVGQNPFEQRPEFGDPFAQGDFSRGSDQDYYHHEGRDARKYLASEGFDISEPGLLHHLRDVLETLDSTTVGRVTQAAGVLFAIDGTVIKKHDGLFPGQWTSENPHAGETAVTVQDIASRGAEVFAALGANGVHVRSSAGAWSHFQPNGTTALAVGTATRIEWLKDRLMVIGTGGREIFEVVANSTPNAIKTLPEGWTFESIFEAGAFLYAPAVNKDAGLSRVHILGLNSAGTAIEDKGSVPIPRGELIYAGIGDPGGIFLGGGRRTPDGGYDPVFYQAIQGDTGFLQLLKITQGEGAGPLDCSVRAFESLGDAIVMSWSVGSGAPTGARTGLAWYHLGRQAFAFHLRKTVATASPVTDIIFHRGLLLFSVEGDGLYYEDVENYVSEAYLLSSIADWGTAGLKSWDQVEVSHKALPSSASVLVQYTTEHPDENDWTTAITSSTAGALGAAGRISDVVSRLFAVKLISRATTDASSAPEIQTFSVRSNPTRPQPEYVLTRFVRLLSKDRKDGRGTVQYVDPVARRIALQQLLDSWVVVYEPGITWTAFVKDISDAEPAEPFLSATGGEKLKEAYLVRLDMVATGEAA